MSTGKPFRILSLDGGGIRGVYSASVLAELEKRTGKACCNHFDLIIGTSTGGILAIALASGIPAAEILDFYKKYGCSIFPGMGVGRIALSIRRVWRPKYSSEPLQQALTSVLGRKTFRETHCRLAVTAYSTKRNDLQLFKNFTPSDPHHHLDLSSVGVAMATSAAPTYFRAFTFHSGHSELDQPYLDGGVCANCPVLVGVVEAISNVSIDVHDIRVLSVGTLYDDFRVGISRQRGGFGQWNTGAVDLLMHGQQAGAVTTAEALLRDRMVRVTQETADAVGLDDVGRISDLESWGKRDLFVPRGHLSEKPIDGIERRLRFFDDEAHYPFRPPQSKAA